MLMQSTRPTPDLALADLLRANTKCFHGDTLPLLGLRSLGSRPNTRGTAGEAAASVGARARWSPRVLQREVTEEIVRNAMVTPNGLAQHGDAARETEGKTSTLPPIYPHLTTLPQPELLAVLDHVVQALLQPQQSNTTTRAGSISRPTEHPSELFEVLCRSFHSAVAGRAATQQQRQRRSGTVHHIN